ncbi:hypothetical protein ZHAS_00013347 [Anopheles sinensis]|uniref:C2H2-type domain-containing protein n=1 Tax=Anopheles sinensis TaxID=74873 RepID=A0A084W5C2_ANOSI|nr:hypothetical protein ZHAS_00013347 [Anopheles sinensis]
MQEVNKALNDQKHEVELEQVVVEERQQDRTKDGANEHDEKAEHVEFIIDIDVEHTEEDHLDSLEKETDYVLVNVASDEEENGDSSTSVLQDEDHKQAYNSQNEEQEEETEPTKQSTRLPRVHSMMCEFCFKEFKSLPDKIDHTESHRTEQKPFKCFHEGCSSSFKDRVGLRSHVRIHASVKRFGCRYCLMRFHTRGNRNAHERTHNGEKPFVCPKCGKGFAEGGNLKNHIRFHTGERPYPCTICDKSYRTHYSRSVHMRSHTNERPFVCDDCGKGFYSTGKLTIHRRIHTGERPYDCDSCDARFIERCDLIVIGNETFVVTLQDQRNIVDRRNWFLSRLDSTKLENGASQKLNPPLNASNDWQTFIVRLLQELSASAVSQTVPTASIQNGTLNQRGIYCFHYDKQTDTDDLPYYQNRDRLARVGTVVKHVHYYVECGTKSKATNTDDANQRMDCDPITDDEDMNRLWDQNNI